MEGIIITDTKYAEECKKADVSLRPPFLTAEQKRQQIQRNHEEVVQRHLNKNKEI